jgi:uncharacterized protein (DUF1800 family)
MTVQRRECLQRLGGAALLGWLPGMSHAAAVASAEALNPSERALHALNRLGFGPRPGDAAAIQAQGPERWLQQFLAEQLTPTGLALPAALQGRLQALDTLSLDQGQLLDRYREAQKLNREAKKNSEDKKGENARRELVRPVVQQAGAQRLLRALDSPTQLQEVLVDFWFNHFNVYAGKGPVAVLVGDYERRAIRPHVLGSFRAMLGATAKHPAMLIYLDNVQSVAPGFQPPARGRVAYPNANAKRPTGLNENYARELMELHTLGVDGGYSQRDVTELARMLTGWTIDYRELRRGGSARDSDLFTFDPRRHDGGSKQWLGRSVRPAGQAEGEMALDVLAAHPATARHLSYKLAQYFVADEPSPALVQRLADRFLAAAGPKQLQAVMQTLVESDEFWRREAFGAKFKTPYQYLLSSLRALDSSPPDMQPLLVALAQAGMPLYGAQTPDGYKNVASAWMNPEALAQRIQLAKTLNERRQRRGGDAADGLLATLGPLIGPDTRRTVAAEPPAMQLALLLGSPDFMRR